MQTFQIILNVLSAGFDVFPVREAGHISNEGDGAENREKKAS